MPLHGNRLDELDAINKQRLYATALFALKFPEKREQLEPLFNDVGLTAEEICKSLASKLN